MRTIARSILTVSAVVCASTLFVVHRYQGLLQAQRPGESQLEYRVDNTVRERGVVESANSIDVRCELPGTSTILYVVAEGSLVKKGDLLVELDAAGLREDLAKAEILVEQAKAQVSRSEAELVSVKKDGAAAIQFAEKALEAALVSKESVLADGGKLAYELTVTRSELAVATARVSTVEKLMEAAPKDRTSKSLDELRLAQIEATEAIKVAEARKVMLEKYERNARTVMLDLAVAEKRMLLGARITCSIRLDEARRSNRLPVGRHWHRSNENWLRLSSNLNAARSMRLRPELSCTPRQTRREPVAAPLLQKEPKFGSDKP